MHSFGRRDRTSSEKLFNYWVAYKQDTNSNKQQQIKLALPKAF